MKIPQQILKTFLQSDSNLNLNSLNFAGGIENDLFEEDEV
jgi:hypothetical protein